MSELRTKLLGDGYRAVEDSTDTHQLAEANLKKNQELRKAFGIRDDYVDGSSFSVMGKFGEGTVEAKSPETQEET